MARSKYQILLGTTVLLATIAGRAESGIEFGQPNLLQFDNREIIFDTDLNSTVSATDRIVGVLQLNGINTPNGAQSTIPETTGVFDLTAAHVLAVSGNIDGIAGGTVISPLAVADGGGGAVNGKYDGTAVVLFRPTNVTGAEGLLGTAGIPALGLAGLGQTAGTALALYEGGPANVQSTLDDGAKTTKDVFLAATDGALVGEFGFSSAATVVSDWGKAGVGYWAGIVTYTAGISTLSGTFFYGLDVLGGPIGIFGAQPLLNAQIGAAAQVGTFTTGIGGATSIPGNIPVADGGSGTIPFELVGKGSQIPNTLAGGASTSAADQAKFPIFSQDPAILQPNTPEPGSVILALMGAGCAAPFVRRRRSKGQKA